MLEDLVFDIKFRARAFKHVFTGYPKEKAVRGLKTPSRIQCIKSALGHWTIYSSDSEWGIKWFILFPCGPRGVTKLYYKEYNKLCICRSNFLFAYWRDIHA